ncbi:MAG: type I methionyl aminopeptidase [Candidatus Kapabacteria bacterium]|nr:type I methionyl aminopeptidase [Candidatus Kapabacteria bacterium]
MVGAPSVKVKSALDYIEEACRIVADTIMLVGKYMKPGVNTLEIDQIADDYICSRGALPSIKNYQVPWTTIINGKECQLVYKYATCISVNDAVVHGLPSKDCVLQEGDIVSFDCLACKNGYHGDAAYTFGVGVISEEKARLLRVTQEALMLGLEQATGRNKVYAISGAIQKHVEKNGFSCVRELVGHGIGESIHEEPSIPNFIPPLMHRDQYPNVRLRAGQTLAIEPMVNAGKHKVYTDKDGWTVRTVDGKPSAHFEHTVLVQEKEPPIILTLLD